MFSLSPRAFHSLIIAPALLSLFFAASANPDNQPPVANPDHYTVHGSFSTPIDSPPYGVLKNDSDPDGDPLSCVFSITATTLGTAIVFANGTADFDAANGQTGTVTIPYTVCDDHGACAGSTITFDVVNQAPVASPDEYTVHGVFETGLVDPPPYGVLKNDSDPDGDAISCQERRVDTDIGTVIISANGKASFVQNNGHTGDVSITYTVCDNLGACSEGNVIFHVVNNAPVAANDVYVVRGPVFESPLDSPPYGVLKNDSDPENDPLQTSFTRVDFAEGSGFVFDNGRVDFVRNNNYLNFSGSLSMQYPLRDSLGATSVGTVTFLLIGDGENDGVCSGCADGGGAMSVGGPINVSNGNMYLQQSDYSLPSIGPGINIGRTYNSDSSRTGLLGRGWSTIYDESITTYDNSLLRFNQADGRAIYFGRAAGSSDPLSPLVGDFHGALSASGAGSTITLKDGTVRQFNSSGRLVSIADRSGNTTTLNYDGSGLLTSINDPFGRSLTVTTNANGQVTSIGDSLGPIANYTYGGSNELLSVTYADNSAFNFSYDGSTRLTSVSDALGNIVESHTYDGQGRAVTSEKQGGVDHYALSFVGANETDVTDGLGRLTKYTFDTSNGRNVVTLVEGLCSCGGGNGSQVQTWTYDTQLNVTSKVDALNHVSSYTYDTNGNRLTGTDATGTVSYTYNAFAEVLTRTDQMGGVTTNTYDPQGNLLTSTNALGKTTTLTYDPRGLLLTVADARGKVTTFTYDSNGNLIKRTDALNHDTQFGYDARGRLTSTTNALGFANTFVYDAAGRLTQVTQADATTIGYEYDSAGRRTAMTDAKGNRSTFAYDGGYRLISQTDAANQTTSYGYDVMSNLTSVTDALARTTNYDYDDFNRLEKTTYPPATTGATRLFETVAYDAGGNVTKRADTAGRATSYAYDEVNRVTSTTDALNEVTSFEYDALSRMTALVDAIGQRYRFNYDAIGQLRHLRRGAEVMSFTYDSVGNRKTRTDYNGAVTDYTYDALNRLKTITYPDTATVRYTYDKLSRLQTATNENGAVNFDYNKMNRVTAVTDVFGQVVDYNYDANGNRTKLSLNSAIVQMYKYDAIDRLTKILDAAGLAFTYDYDATNKLTQKKMPNGVKTTYQYDGVDRLTRLLDAKGVATVADRQYAYNTASQVTQISEPAITKSYGYDSVDRLTSANYTNPLQANENYSYDGVGNRLASQLSASYTYQRFNRLASTSEVTFVYDANGNLTSKTDSNGTTQNAWDFENRLKQVTLPNGTTVSYKYDALGRRVQRTPSTGVSTNFVYDGQDVVKDLNSDSSTVDYLNGPGIDNKLRLTDSRLIALGPLYFLQDQLGSTTALTNSLGTSVAQVSYDAFGNSNGSELTRYDYTGRERDAMTGLLYYRARWYDPQVGRFISEDPIGLSGGINQFSYVGDDSPNATDPSGLYEIDVHYYLTYYLALKTGCFKDWEAMDIANADQRTDEDGDTKPGYGNTDQQRMQNRVFHALYGGAAEGVGSPLLWKGAMNQTNGHQWIGRYLHYLQDTFSHAGYSDDTWGHSPPNVALGSGNYGDHDTDKTASDPAKALRMAGATWGALVQYAKAKKCTCNPQWNASWWTEIREFIGVATNDPHGSTIDAIGSSWDNPGVGDPGALTRKRRILGLRDRYSGQW